MVLEATPSVEKEINPWLSAAARFDEAANRLGLDEGLCKVLRMAAMELTVHIPVQLDEIIVSAKCVRNHSIDVHGGSNAPKCDPALTK